MFEGERMNKKLILVFCVLLCSITGGYLYLSSGGEIPFIKIGCVHQKDVNGSDSSSNGSLNNHNGSKDVKALKEGQIHEVNASEDEQGLINNSGYGDELFLGEDEIKAMANEYQVSIDEIKDNIDYYNYQWQLDHPESVDAAQVTTLNIKIAGLKGSSGLKTLADYIYYHFDWKRGAATTYQGVIKTGYGDCWGLTDFSKHVLEANDYTVKVQEIKTSQSNHHRRLLVLLNGNWVVFDPSLCTKHYNYKPY